ncbi:MAG: lipooligosaccharide transport system permease protein [Methanomicrobiaceae archaeon]|nr:lipooligosaccharide transport system permease protein [Methanomicrobiaceae archaeon]MDK2862571.1 lipooligosaccharide transport system permease protein [Methanomicrobiaceae archaeon]
MFECIQRVGSVWQRNLEAFLRTYRVNFIPPFIEPLLYLLALGFGLGTYIEAVDGVPYPVFIAPALVSISVMNSAFYECTYSSFVRMYYQKTFDAIIATPVSIDEVIAGEMIWGATRGVIYAGLMLPVLILFGVAAMPSSLLLIPFAFIAGLLFAGIAMCFTAITPSIETLNYPSFLFITPMFLFSGTFFPLDLLPEAVRYAALAALPLTHVVEINRAITLEAVSAANLLNLAWIAVATAVFCSLAIRLMKRRLVV